MRYYWFSEIGFLVRVAKRSVTHGLEAAICGSYTDVLRSLYDLILLTRLLIYSNDDKSIKFNIGIIET